ncbi:hypothetical protein PPERSA_10779 [Pseudocohnilembus persalinus]|uniref:Uncharacterized protein n=1 Tax=Pseudocohnilembus persalinus TaxID=266149 RepID=A0A0V0QDN0_PSEPJ|nr:hypothetical protein PPERSA_10779 [Pseudocohnilembus persalinus]|eukprot:KRX00280.1 hypothetical protein PPERSA_10779 [Pseudocohnilembus persalinus]
MSKKFEAQENIDKFLGKEEQLVKLNKQVENLEKQLQKKVKVFEEQIYIQDDDIIQVNQYNDGIQNQDQYQKQQIQFYKSMWNKEHKVQEDIKIIQNDQKNGHMIIKFDRERQGLEQQVYSQILNKKATYHLKMKLNLFGENRQNVVFFLLDYKNRNIEWGGQNQIMISSYQGYTNAGNVIEKAANGQNFSEFMQDNETVYNIVFDYSRKLFQVYDDDKKCQINTVLDTEKIKGGMVFGMDFYQYYQKKAVYEILEINVKQNHME